MRSASNSLASRASERDEARAALRRLGCNFGLGLDLRFCSTFMATRSRLATWEAPTSVKSSFRGIVDQVHDRILASLPIARRKKETLPFLI